MKPKKIAGWALFVLGLLIIFWGLYSSYNIFTAKKEVPKIFKIEKTAEKEEEKNEEKEEKAESPETLSPEQAQERAQEEMKEIMEEEIKSIIPSEFISKILNLMSWAVFAGILIFGGGRVSTIGIRLIKEA